MGVAVGGLASLLHAGMGLTAQAPDTTRRDSAVVLPPVTIAATRSERELFALPLAVSRVKPHTWFGTSGSGLSDALGLVPGVVSQSRAGGTDVRITIRGFGARGAGDRSNSGTTRGIRVLLDGFPETEPDGRTSLDGIDLAAAHGVEVVRSNSSAVWGNAAGGVLSVSTVPETEGRLLDGEAMAGSFALWRWALRGGVALGPGRALASVTRTEFGGWREHSASDRSLVNLAFVTPPGHRTTVGVFAVGSDNFFEIPGPLTAAQVAADPAQANSTYAQRNERRHNRVARLGATFDHQATRSLGLSGMLYINPKYLQRSERGTFRDFTRYHLGGNVVARVATPLGSGVTGTLQAGVDAAYQDGAILFYSLTSEGGRGDTLRSDQREGASNLGVFLQEELALGERWAVTLGARWDDITYRAEDFLAPDLAARKSFQRLSPKLGLSYRVGATHGVYAAVGGGVEAPAGNETDPASTFGQDTVTALNPLLDPIRSVTYEVGTRASVRLDGALRELAYDVALYDTEVENEIIPYRGGRFYFTAGRVRRQGAELGLTLRLAGGVSLQTALAYADHRYVEYAVDSVHYGVPGATADYSGNALVGVAPFTYAASVEAAPRALHPVWARVMLEGISGYYADDANAVRVDPYAVVNLSVGVGDAVRVAGVSVRGFVTVNNVLDKRYSASVFLNPDVVAGEPVAYEPGMPRSWLVGLTVGAR